MRRRAMKKGPLELRKGKESLTFEIATTSATPLVSSISLAHILPFFVLGFSFSLQRVFACVRCLLPCSVACSVLSGMRSSR